MLSPSVSVCFPAYNEESTVAVVVGEAYQILRDSGYEYELITCDDGSEDDTGKILDELAKEIPSLRVIHHSKNLGIRATFEHLYKVANKEYVFLNSTDCQWDTAILLDMLPLAAEWNVIIASRKRKPYGLIRRFISWIFNLVPEIFFGVKTYDAGAVKLVKREIIQRFNLVSKTPFTEAERLIRAARAGYRITEFPVYVNPRQRGKAKGVKAIILLETIVDIWRVWKVLTLE